LPLWFHDNGFVALVATSLHKRLIEKAACHSQVVEFVYLKEGANMKNRPQDNPESGESGSVDRRRFLGAMGSGAAALGASGLFGSGAALAQSFVLREENFGRMFPDLPPFFDRATNSLNRAMVEIGKLGGVLDAKDRLPASGSGADQAQAAINLIVDPALNVNNPNNTTHTAGTTFMGQFMDHDMTFDQTSALGLETEPEESPNTRSPTLDLDSVYLGGPRRAPHL
jgi:hypothetical protein